MPSTQRVVKKCLIYWSNRIRLGFVSVDYHGDISNSDTSWQFSWLLQWPRIDCYWSCPTLAYWETWEEDITIPYGCFTFLIWSRVWQRICYLFKCHSSCAHQVSHKHFRKESLFSFRDGLKRPKKSVQIYKMSNHQPKLVRGKQL